MLMEEVAVINNLRRDEIKKYIENKGIVTIKELSSLFSSVSLMTIHRDLDTLEQEGCIIRVRGGAKYIGGSSDHEPAYELRATKNKKAKEIIAQKAVKLLSGGRAVFLDAGSTMMELAMVIPDIPASIVTNGPNIAMELAKRQNVTVNLCGGTLNRTNMILTGSAAIEMLSRINIDIAFIVASGYSAEGGFTCGKEAEAFVKHEVIRKARTVAMLLDNSKIGAMLPFTFANMEDNIDVDASPYIYGADLKEMGQDLLELTRKVANGMPTKAEALGYTEMAIARQCNFV